jgi:hypothetical protein
MGVGRETTADELVTFLGVAAYTMGVGRETTAHSIQARRLVAAYTMGVGRETTAVNGLTDHEKISARGQIS